MPKNNIIGSLRAAVPMTLPATLPDAASIPGVGLSDRLEAVAQMAADAFRSVCGSDVVTTTHAPDSLHSPALGSAMTGDEVFGAFAAVACAELGISRDRVTSSLTYDDAGLYHGVFGVDRDTLKFPSILILRAKARDIDRARNRDLARERKRAAALVAGGAA